MPSDDRQITRRVIRVSPDDVERVRTVLHETWNWTQPITISPVWFVHDGLLSRGSAIPSDFSTFDERVHDHQHAARQEPADAE
mgnify:CR=1 FL=1